MKLQVTLNYSILSRVNISTIKGQISYEVHGRACHIFMAELKDQIDDKVVL